MHIYDAWRIKEEIELKAEYQSNDDKVDFMCRLPLIQHTNVLDRRLELSHALLESVAIRGRSLVQSARHGQVLRELFIHLCAAVRVCAPLHKCLRGGVTA